ncbi:MAG: acyl-CoA/acyl-ACP dehydrogenase [Rhodospirillaceae bacterium]|jgi:acyl-CoA dehydrogenase|nr:acyl-CoA/acyl-ACP dehydrogenase [Rhodospirillaceae bacterium]
MNFELDESQRLIAETARRVGQDFGLDYWREKDEAKAYPFEMWQAVCDAGLCGVALPEEYGGSALGMIEMAVIIENLSEGGGGGTVGQLFMNNPIFGGVAIAKFGSDAMKRELLPKLSQGKMRFAMALTEPDAGTNTPEITTFARPDGNGWRLDGRKIWITGVPQAHKILVIARTTKLDAVERRTQGMTMFLVDTEREGLTHQSIDKLGTNTQPSSNVYFDDVRVDPEEVIGTVDKGWTELLEVLNTERIVTTAACVGAGRLALRLAVDYAAERKVFRGVPIGSYQGLQFPLAQCHAELECARLMNLKAAWLHDQGLPYGSESNTAKLIGAQALAKATERAMQTMGGMGFAKEMHAERLWRDARLFKFAPISEEMILNFIAQHDLGMPRSY